MAYHRKTGRDGEGYMDPTAEQALKNLERSRRGAINKRQGEAFEQTIEASLIYYKNSGVAEIEKTPEPMKPVSRADSKGRFLAVFTKPAQPDFKGTLAGGRSVVFEAKYTIADQIDQKVVSKDQGDRLESHHRLGAVAFVLVGLGVDGFYRVPWETWRDMKSIYGRKHMKKADLFPFKVRYVGGVLRFLDTTERGGCCE